MWFSFNPDQVISQSIMQADQQRWTDWLIGDKKIRIQLEFKDYFVNDSLRKLTVVSRSAAKYCDTTTTHTKKNSDFIHHYKTNKEG